MFKKCCNFLKITQNLTFVHYYDKVELPSNVGHMLITKISPFSAQQCIKRKNSCMVDLVSVPHRRIPFVN